MKVPWGFDNDCREINPDHACYCIKSLDHIKDCTNDDHRCCSGHTWEDKE